MSLEPDLQTLLSIVELIAIRQHKAFLSISRTPDGWTVAFGEGGEAAQGETLTDALLTALVPRQTKDLNYETWSPDPQGTLFQKGA